MKLSLKFLLILNCIIQLSLMLISDKWILTNSFYASAIAEWNAGSIENIFPDEQLKWLIYSVAILLNLAKCLLLAALFYSGFKLAGCRISFRQGTEAVLLADMIFLVPAALKVAWFLIHPPSGFNEWQNSYPLSLLSLVDPARLDMMWLYPLRILNAFELLYLLVLAFLFKRDTMSDYNTSLRIILKTYLPLLILWTGMTMIYTVKVSTL
ncbi:hypothetical protein GS399_03050 [Pedobacter sp. HMF7647]|uniref:Yip1 domain-containing protein n=1 Tax=Hufsiella arboris TaxID=2695275 RepID=A0A7K1Y5T6_9SPHI|nr:hypothetical protein [Hufsiella arboris]MXV49935.1 hypothetical protein [Hufsiella arboris]